MNDERKNVLLITYRALMLPLSVIGLASLGDRIIAWKGFILEAIQLFRAITHPIYETLLFWVPEVPEPLMDYWSLSAMCASAFYTGVWYGIPDPDTGESTTLDFSSPFEKGCVLLVSALMIFALSGIMGWALFFALPVAFIQSRFDGDQHLRRSMDITFQWLGLVLLGFLILVALNGVVR